MLAEGDFEIAMEDELSDSGTEASTDYETYDLETEEPNDETEEETDESEAEAKTKSNKSATDETCELVTSKPNRPIAHAISQHGVKIGISGKIKEDCKMLESEEKKSRKVVNNGSKPRDIRRYCCQICGLVRAKRKRLETHIMLHHGAEIGATEIDKLIEKKNPEDCEAKKDGKCESNGIKVRELRRYCCKLCGPVRSKRELLENHIILEHSEEMNSKGEMNKFVVKRRSEDDQRRYSCQMCGVLRSKRTLLKLHILSSHGREICFGRTRQTFVCL